MPFILYTTEGCHLCDHALALTQAAGLEVQLQEIAFDEQLFALYGVRIPVLKHEPSADELGWPFDAQGLAVWLASLKPE